MHHLHPRSRSTSTLFTTTLAVCFLVVTMPHLLPCPVDRRQFADTIEDADGKMRRRRKAKPADETSGSPDETTETGRRARECPVPKPRGIVGQIMGFKDEMKQPREMKEVVVRSLDARRGNNEKLPED